MVVPHLEPSLNLPLKRLVTKKHQSCSLLCLAEPQQEEVISDEQVVDCVLSWVCCHSRAAQIARNVVSAADDDRFSKTILFLAIQIFQKNQEMTSVSSLVKVSATVLDVWERNWGKDSRFVKSGRP